MSKRFDWQEESRAAWHHNTQPTDGQVLHIVLALGCLQRIATSLEKIEQHLTAQKREAVARSEARKRQARLRPYKDAICLLEGVLPHNLYSQLVVGMERASYYRFPLTRKRFPPDAPADWEVQELQGFGRAKTAQYKAAVRAAGIRSKTKDR